METLISKDLQPSAPTDAEVDAVQPTTFSFSEFVGPERIYPQMQPDSAYVQKPYEERLSDKAQTHRIAGTIDFVPTQEFEEFEQNLQSADQLKAKYRTTSEPNWVQKVGVQIQKLVGDRSPKSPALTIDDPAFYQKYFNNKFAVRSPLALNPEYTSPTAHILKRAMCLNQPAELLAGQGLHNVNSLQLSSIGLGMMDFRIHQRSAADMKKMFTDLDKLSDAGFNAKSFDAKLWSLHNICAAYNERPENVIEHFEMCPSDIVAAGVPANQLHTYGVQMNHLVTDPNFFQLIVASGFTPQKFVEHYNAIPRQFFDASGACLLNPAQANFLGHMHDWKTDNLIEAGFEKIDISAFRGKKRLRGHQ
jgi:hypothetical protein